MITEATCTEEGVASYTCTVCGETKTEAIPTIEHQYEVEFSIVDNTVSAVSEEASRAAAVADAAEDISFIATLTCTACGDVEVVDATETGSTTTEVTCTEDGTTIYTVTCTYGGETYSGQVVVVNEEATGHNYVDGVCTDCGEEAPEHTHTYASEVTTEATCTTDGVLTYTCTECGDSYTEVIPATGHSYEAVVTEPTCTVGGYTTYTCPVCGDSYIADETAATGHNYVDGVCTVCGAEEPGEGEHTHSCYTAEVTVAATCTTDGVMTYTCTECGDSYTEVIPATGHNYVDGVCTVCGAEEPGEGEHTHSYTAEVTVAATCTTDGVMTYTCTECGDSYTEVIPATGHNYVDGVCTVCGATEPGEGGSSGWSGLDALSTILSNVMNRIFTMLTSLFTKFW